jgi:hypothetical protein
MGMQLGRTLDVLAVDAVLDLALDEHGHGLLHLVADDAAFDRAQRFVVVAHVRRLTLRAACCRPAAS